MKLVWLLWAALCCVARWWWHGFKTLPFIPVWFALGGIWTAFLLVAGEAVARAVLS